MAKLLLGLIKPLGRSLTIQVNTTEKRKIESIINADIQSALATYKGKRSSEYSSMKAKFEKTPPKEVMSIVSKIKGFRQQTQKAESELEKLGWSMSSYQDEPQMRSCRDYSKNRNGEYTSQAKELVEHESETSKKVREMEALGRKYTLLIYSGNGEAEKLIDAFTQEVSKLLK